MARDCAPDPRRGPDPFCSVRHGRPHGPRATYWLQCRHAVAWGGAARTVDLVLSVRLRRPAKQGPVATTNPFPFTNFLRPTTEQSPRGEALAHKATELITEYESALADADKATDPEDEAFYSGKVEGLTHALSVLLDVPKEAWDAYQRV